jgi:hypothetical protein
LENSILPSTCPGVDQGEEMRVKAETARAIFSLRLLVVHWPPCALGRFPLTAFSFVTGLLTGQHAFASPEVQALYDL